LKIDPMGLRSPLVAHTTTALVCVRSALTGLAGGRVPGCGLPHWVER
jgi:hypothetical protein